MEFKLIYLRAMAERAPAMFRQLKEAGELDDHVAQKTIEAHRMLESLLADEPKYPGGVPKDLQAKRLAEEQVIASFLDFPVDIQDEEGQLDVQTVFDGAEKAYESQMRSFQEHPSYNPTPVQDFLKKSGDHPYRKFVEHHLRRQTVEQVASAITGEVSLLPPEYQRSAEIFIDAVIGRLGHDKTFWSGATCRDAFDRIMHVAVDVFPFGDRVGDFEDFKTPENENILFGLFQVITLNFAYLAAIDRKARKFMGLRKGLFS